MQEILFEGGVYMFTGTLIATGINNRSGQVLIDSAGERLWCNEEYITKC